ncbi:MAG: B12-binding domain-containing radical SAM protein [bacterium]|nr:B12-binding domain-containing radical SAM protein [bacterium]
MNKNYEEQKNDTNGSKEKILLVMAPFWPALIPPVGIACLKSFLLRHGYRVKTVDMNVEKQFDDIYSRYFDLLVTYIPAEKQGNFQNIGEDVLRNHMMAFFNRQDQQEYVQLVQALIENTFFTGVEEEAVFSLHRIIEDFYSLLSTYFNALVEKEKPDVLGFSLYEGTLPASLFAAQLTRESYPHIKIVVGGGLFAEQLSAGSPNWDVFLRKTPYIDKVITGEGENLFLEYLQGKLPDSQRVYTLENRGGKTMPLVSVPVPDFTDFDLDRYPYLASYTSRSCPFQCSFCSETIQWGKFRKKETAQIVRELKHLNKVHKRQLFLMCDSLMNPVISGLAEAMLEEDVPIYWDGYLRADKNVCDMDNTILWRRGGFYRARLGIESGSQRVLDLMGKKITTDQIKQAIGNLAAAGIKTTTYWVIGYPGETEEDFQETLKLVEELGNDIFEAWCSPLYYYPKAQVKSEEWSEKHTLLYPEKAKDMLVLQTWIQDCLPSREETYDRMYRFVRHCNTLGVPNPFTLRDVNRADKRWKTLHKNAVPALLEFQTAGKIVNESRDVKPLCSLHYSIEEDGDFGF